jgi:hypothetical protein
MGVSKSRNVLDALPVHFCNDSSSIEFRIVDYQYPENSRDQYDVDWLRVEGVITHPLGNWRLMIRAVPLRSSRNTASIADYTDEVIHAALDINIPNYASAVVGTEEIVASLSAL